MSYENNNVDKDDIENLRMKILDIGMYEIGMSVQEMKDLLEIVQQSEQTASQENEYRSTLLDTEKNCADLSLLISDSKPRKKIQNNITDKIALSNDIESRSRLSFDVKGKNKASNITMSDNSITFIDSNITNDVIQMSTFNDHLDDRKNIDVFMSNTSYKGNLERMTNDSNLLLPFHCRPEILRMPVELRAKAIDKYHQTVHDQYTQMQRESLDLLKWSKSIPCITMDKDQQSSTDLCMLNPLKDNILGRRACNMKRKMYQESSSDDEKIILNKKSKEVLPKYLQDKIEKSSERKPMQINDYESYEDKIFDDVIVQGDQKESNNKSKHVYNALSSSDDDISPKIIISAMVHHEKTPVKRNFKMLRDKKLIVKSKITEDLDSISSANDILCPSETNEECHSMKQFTRSATKNDLEFQLADNKLNLLEPVSSNGDKPYKRRVVPPNPLQVNLSQRTHKIISNIKKKRKNPKCVIKPEYQICNDKDSVEENKITKILEIPTNIFYNSNKNNEECIVLDDEYTCPMCNKNINMSIIKQHIANCSKSKLQIIDETSGSQCFYCREYITDNCEEHLENCEEKT